MFNVSVSTLVIVFNSVYFIQPNITHSEFSIAGFTICTHTASLTFDLTSDQGKNFYRQETFSIAAEEDPSPGWTEGYMSCDYK